MLSAVPATIDCYSCGETLRSDQRFCSSCGASAAASSGSPLPIVTYAAPGARSQTLAPSDQDLVRRISEYEKISGILWIVLGILQVLSILLLWLPGPFIGIWNIIGGRARLRQAPRIMQRSHTIPADFEPIGGLIVVGIFNLLIGGVVGVAFVFLDFYVRDRVLTHRHLFTDR